MTVFKTFWKIVNKYKGTIILFTVMLVVFGGMNMATNDNAITFENSKPDILIVNNDENVGLTKNLISYMTNNANIKEIKKENIDDALFYRDISYVIYIPKNYRKDLLELKNPTIDIKQTKDYEASLASILLNRYLRLQNIYLKEYSNEDEVIKAINSNLEINTNIEVTNKKVVGNTNLTRYYNFASYSIMAVVSFIICIILSSFHNKNISKRINVSSMNYKKHNRLILYSSILYGIILWFIYSVIGVFVTKTNVFTGDNIIYLINSLMFTFTSLSLAIFISSLTTNKDAINGIVNVVSLGQAFICGAFIPTEWLPSIVIKIAHILPSYWYINTNDIVVNGITSRVFINISILFMFGILFIILTNLVTYKKRKNMIISYRLFTIKKIL